MSNCFGFGNLRALRELILHAFIAITVQFLAMSGRAKRRATDNFKKICAHN